MLRLEPRHYAETGIHGSDQQGGRHPQHAARHAELGDDPVRIRRKIRCQPCSQRGALLRWSGNRERSASRYGHSPCAAVRRCAHRRSGWSRAAPFRIAPSVETASPGSHPLRRPRRWYCRHEQSLQKTSIAISQHQRALRLGQPRKKIKPATLQCMAEAHILQPAIGARNTIEVRAHRRRKSTGVSSAASAATRKDSLPMR